MNALGKKNTRRTTRLAYKDALDVDGLDEVAQQSSLVSQNLPLSDFVSGGHADHAAGRVLETC